jgi:predicted phosphodiesterase
MRIALFSDIHGNPIALDAVLADIRDLGDADEYWALGDLAGIGYDPAGVLERLASLPGLRTLRGNTDRYVLTGDRPPPTREQVARRPELADQYDEVTRSFAWTAGFLAASGWLPWPATLGDDIRQELPDGTRVLGVHAAPGTDDGPGLQAAMSDADLRAAVTGCQAGVVFAGHTHRPMDRTVDGIRLVNLGSVSNPLTPDKRASYVFLAADRDGYQLEHRRVPYDPAAVLAAIDRSGHPCAAFLRRFYS